MSGSIIYPGERVFDDSTPDHHFEPPEGFGKGFSGRRPEGYGAAAVEFPAELLIPRSEWQARIEEREAQGRQISQRVIKKGLKSKSQADTLFCWCNAPVHTVEILRLLDNAPPVILSPASVACQVNGFVNQGGWAKDAVTFITKNGISPVNLWPANAIDRRYVTKEMKAASLAYRIEKWFTGQPRNIDQLVSMLLRDMPVDVAYNWWEHEVTACDAVWVNGAIGIRPRNSWDDDWPGGHLGFFVLQGNKMLPDDFVCPVTVQAG